MVIPQMNIAKKQRGGKVNNPKYDIKLLIFN